MDTVEYLERRSDRCPPLDRWLVEDAEDAARAENEGYRLGRPGSPTALHEHVLRVARPGTGLSEACRGTLLDRPRPSRGTRHLVLVRALHTRSERHLMDTDERAVAREGGSRMLDEHTDAQGDATAVRPD